MTTRDLLTAACKREIIRHFLLCCFIGMALFIAGSAFSAEYYENEPRAQGYSFQIHPSCKPYVKFHSDLAAEKYSTFIKTEVSGDSSNQVGYDGTDLITCLPIEQPANALRLDCWPERGMWACSSDLIEESSGAVVGRATWWRQARESVELLECDIQLDQEADYFQRVVTHEFGHCHGLAHTSHYEAVMYHFAHMDGGFHFDDIIGLCHLYGCDKDIADDFGRIVINEIVIPGQPEIWTGVVTVGKVVTAYQVP